MVLFSFLLVVLVVLFSFSVVTTISSDISTFAIMLSIIPVITTITIIIELAVAIQPFWHKPRRCARGDAGATLFSIWGESQEEAGNDCGAVVAVAERWRINPQRSVLCQEETSASGEAESSASGDTGKARGDTGKAQGGSVPQGRRADCDRGDRPSRRGERESEK